jgi:hypothetical protein
MNLISPALAAKMGKRRDTITDEDLYVMFADGSRAHIASSFYSDLSLSTGKYTSNLHTKFYVLPGLTSEVLIGEKTVNDADVFGNHLDAFVDADEHLSLNPIKWLTKIEEKFFNFLNNKGSPTQNRPDPNDPLGEKYFRKTLNEADSREHHRQDQAERRIASLPERERRAARDAETAQAAAYEAERARCIDTHERRILAQQNQPPSTTTTAPAP